MYSRRNLNVPFRPALPRVERERIIFVRFVKRPHPGMNIPGAVDDVVNDQPDFRPGSVAFRFDGNRVIRFRFQLKRFCVQLVEFPVRILDSERALARCGILRIRLQRQEFQLRIHFRFQNPDNCVTVRSHFKPGVEYEIFHRAGGQNGTEKSSQESVHFFLLDQGQ